MDEQNNDLTAVAAPTYDKKPYHTPTLRRLGDISTTQGDVHGGLSDGLFGGTATHS
jgi:hypothetical protein